MTDLPAFTHGDTTGITTVERITCPECGGSGLVDYYAVGADCPCMTCSGGLYEQGTGTIPAPANTEKRS